MNILNILRGNRDKSEKDNSSMHFARVTGYPMTVIGIALYSPPLEKWLSNLYGEVGGLSGLIVFAAGWALLFAYLVFNLGIHVQKNK